MNIIYWCRVGLGIVAALICVLGWTLTNNILSFIEGVTLAIIFYIITYYILKMKFITKVEKTSKLLKTGIGAYFLTWVVSWTLILSLTVPTAVFTYLPNSPKVGETVTFNATASYDIKGYIAKYRWTFVFSNNTLESPQTETPDPILTHTFKTQDNYTVFLEVIDNDGLWSSPRAAVVEVKNITG